MSKQPIPGFGKNWCSRQSSTTGRRRYYFARGDYYSHVQDDPPTQEDHQEQLRLSEKAKKRKGRSSTTANRKKKREVSFNDVEAHGADSYNEAVDQEDTRVVTFAEDKRQIIDSADVDEAIAKVNVQHAEEAREAESKRVADDAATKTQAYEGIISEKVQQIYNEYRQHQDELIHSAGAVIKDRPAYNRVSLVCSTNRPVNHQEVVDAIFRHIDSACDGSFKGVRVVGEISTDVRIYFEHWDGHTTDAIGQLLRWSDGFAFTSMDIFRSNPRADPSHKLFVCNIPYEASSDDLMRCLSRGLDQHQFAADRKAADPFSGCTMRHGFAFVECRDAAIATACLRLDGIELYGRSLRIERPRNYKASANESESTESESWEIHTSSSLSSPAISELTTSPSIIGNGDSF